MTKSCFNCANKEEIYDNGEEKVVVCEINRYIENIYPREAEATASRCIAYKEESLTNDEWRKICSAEEFAEFLFGIAYMCSYCGDEAHSTKEKIQKCHFGKCVCQRQDWEEWLKQPHTIKE